MNIEEIPTKEEAIKAVKRLKKISFPIYKDGEDIEVFVKKISKIITSEFGFLFSTIKPIKVNEFISKLYRAREVELFTNINLIREHSYPPINNTRMGRCNFPKYPVFYCSDNPITAVLEIARNYENIEKEYCISKWERSNSNETLMFEHFLQTDLPEENQYISLRDGLKNDISSPFKKSLKKELKINQVDGILEHLKFLNSTFIHDSDYSISASLAQRSLYANHNCRTDVLMYPSVQTQHKGVNFAIQPNFV